ncbi:MAG: histidine kinase [Aggregatilineales bacterium]
MTTSQHSTHELIILNRIAEALNREVDVQRALQTALVSIVELFKLQTGWIFLTDEETGKLYTAATYGLPPALSEHPRRMGGTCACIDDFEEGEMQGAENINAITCTRLKNLKEGTAGLLYHASIPLYAGQYHEIALGVLNVASTDWREIGEDDLRLLHTVGDLVSIAVERARLFRRSAEIGAMEERNRLAREIHDTIAQGLAAIALNLETADALLEQPQPDIEKIQKITRKTLAITRANMEEARRSVMDLRAAPLEGKTLPQAIRALLENSDLHTSLGTHSEVMGSSPPLPVRISAGLYRIAQEAINNVRQHAEASSLHVILVLLPERVKLIVEDDGNGFDPALIRQKGRYGLIGLEERVKMLGGILDIASSPDDGTRLEVTIPLITLDEKNDE